MLAAMFKNKLSSSPQSKQMTPHILSSLTKVGFRPPFNSPQHAWIRGTLLSWWSHDIISCHDDQPCRLIFSVFSEVSRMWFLFQPNDFELGPQGLLKELVFRTPLWNIIFCKAVFEAPLDMITHVLVILLLRTPPFFIFFMAKAGNPPGRVNGMPQVRCPGSIITIL